MSAAFRTVAAGLVSRIGAQLTYLSTCRTFLGTLDDLGEGGPFDQAPSVYAIFDGMEPMTDLEGFGETAHQANYTLAVVAKSLEGRTDVGEGDTHSAHDIIEDLLAAVSEHNLGITGFSGVAIGSVRPHRITSLTAIYAVQVSAIITITK